MIALKAVHHIAIICSDYQRSKEFYTSVLGFTIINETFRSDQHSYKLDLSLEGKYTIELFSFPDPPPRVSRPEATGLRHIAFTVSDLGKSIALLDEMKIANEGIRFDEITGKRFTFIADPDNLPIELYEV